MKKFLIAAALLAILTSCANLKFEWKTSCNTDKLAQDFKEAGK